MVQIFHVINLQSQQRDSGFIFEWTIDGDVEEDHTTPAPFERLFPYGGRHEIRLKVTYTY